jgi:hypothetical protein
VRLADQKVFMDHAEFETASNVIGGLGCDEVVSVVFGDLW